MRARAPGNLVSSADELELVGLVELAHDVRTEDIARPARGQPPAIDVVWVRPPAVAGPLSPSTAGWLADWRMQELGRAADLHEVAHRAVTRDLLLPVDGPNLVQRIDRRREPIVHAEHGVVCQTRRTAQTYRSISCCLGARFRVHRQGQPG